MSLQTVLSNFVKVVSDEAKRNPEFAERLKTVFKLVTTAPPTKTSSAASSRRGSSTSRPANRRPPAILDPVSLAEKGEETLRARLASLTLDQLKDIVADYGMDQAKLVMKWKKPDRIINRIVEISISRAHKGDAFRS